MDDYPSYKAIVESWGFEVERLDAVGSYQGDYYGIVRDGTRWGFVQFGYGSCSGCDSLEAILPWDPPEDWLALPAVVELSSSLRGEVEWFDSREALVDWVHSTASTERKQLDPSRWYYFDLEFKEWAASVS